MDRNANLKRHTDTVIQEFVVSVKVRAITVGLSEPLVNGTIVTFSEQMSVVGGMGFRRLGIVDSMDDHELIKLPHDSIGIISDNGYHVSCATKSFNVNNGFLKDQNVYQWYLVAFKNEMLWVRFDWLKIFDAAGEQKAQL